MLFGLDGVEIGLIIVFLTLFASILSGFPVAFAIGGAGVVSFAIIAALDSAGLLIHQAIDTGSDAYRALTGEGVRPESVDHRRALTGDLYDDRQRMRDLLEAGMEAMAKREEVDPDRVVAIGYCFGGAAVLDMARAGMDLEGFATFHGGLDTPDGQDYSELQAPLLVLHGTSDESVSMDDVSTLVDELDEEGADFRMELYGGARHAFTVWGGDRYQAQADLESWRALGEFLEERL